jgi:hypothetical protein
VTERETAAREWTCADLRAQVEHYLAGGLDPEAEVSFEAHLVVCDPCFTTYLVRTVDDL